MGFDPIKGIALRKKLELHFLYYNPILSLKYNTLEDLFKVIHLLPMAS
jgi:hypothetical protein